MADWSDLIGRTIKQAEERAKSYGYELAVIRVATTYVVPDLDRTKPTVLVGVNESGPQAIVTSTHGIEHPARNGTA